MPEIKLGQTKISESQIAAFLLNVILFSLPFFDVVLTMVQMEAGSAVLAGVAVFAWNQSRKDKSDA